jgi:hypothetical protein
VNASARSTIVFMLAASSFLLSSPGQAVCVAPRAEVLGPTHVSFEDKVVVAGEHWFKGCCDTEPLQDCEMTPMKDLRLILKEKSSNDETTVARHIDANRRFRFRTSFLIPRGIDTGGYRVLVEPRQGRSIRAGRVIVQEES